MMLALPTVVWAGVLFAIVVYLGTMHLGWVNRFIVVNYFDQFCIQYQSIAVVRNSGLRGDCLTDSHSVFPT